MSGDLKPVEQLAISFDTYQELKAYTDTQYQALQKAFLRVKDLEAEVDHLKSLLAGAVPLIKDSQVDVLPKSTEQLICEMEIEKLMKTSRERSLTLEETKRLDLLVKNLHISKNGQPRDLSADWRRLPTGISEADLMRIAATPDPKVEDV